MVKLSLSTVAILPSASAAKAAVETVENIRAATRAPVRLRMIDLLLFYFARAGDVRREAKQKHCECVKTRTQFCTAFIFRAFLAARTEEVSRPAYRFGDAAPFDRLTRRNRRGGQGILSLTTDQKANRTQPLP